MKAWKNNQPVPSTLASKWAAQPLGSGKASWIFSFLLRKTSVWSGHSGAITSWPSPWPWTWPSWAGPCPCWSGHCPSSWLLGCSLGLGLLSWSMAPPWRRESLHGCPHSWQVALLATLRMNTQLVHGRCGFLQWSQISHSSKGWTWSSSGWETAMVALAAGFLMGMAAGTEARSWAWPWHWCGESGWREEMHLNHMV